MATIKNISVKDKNNVVATYNIGASAENVDYNGANVQDRLDSLKSAAFRDAGAANGVATLDENGKVPSAQLPPNQGIDNVAEYDSYDLFPTVGGYHILYIDLSNNKLYRQDSTKQRYIALSGGAGVDTAKNIFFVKSYVGGEE